MRVHKLLLDLEAFLKASLADYGMPDPMAAPGMLGLPQIFFGNVQDSPPDALPGRFPFIVVRWSEGESEEDPGGGISNEEEIALILGVYAPQGHAEAELVTAALLDHLRAAFMRSRSIPGEENVFDLVLPLRAAKPDPEKKQHLYHIATLITRWRHMTPRRPLQGVFDE